ncbi:ParA family protein [Pseudomonas tritici]|uniref:ParA family protein n=1 Tax=Pseudomonas tritici TaxID=2745518 RepID=UPI00387B9082
MTTKSKPNKAQSKAAEVAAIRSKVVALALTAVLTPLSKIITITNQKGGVGKTSTSFNYAHYLNELGYRVLAVDLDGQGNLTELFFKPDVLNQYVHTSALDLFTEGTADNFEPLSHPCGIDVIATRRNCHELNNVDTFNLSVAEVFFNNLSPIAANYDFVVIDTPPAPGVRTTSACAAADYIYAPVLVDTFAESALEGVLSSVESIGQIIGADLSITGILINGLQDGTEDTKAKYNILAARIGPALIPTSIRQSKPFSRAQGVGVPVWHLRRSGAERVVSLDTRKAYGEMAARIPEIPAERIEHFNEVSRAVRLKIAAELAAN